VSEYICGTDGNGGHWETGEQIVRCRDCEHMAIVDFSGLHGNHDHDPMFCQLRDVSAVTYPDCFCSWGKRKEDE
jgi:hypothetical protein